MQKELRKIHKKSETKLLPHEFLHRVALGEPITQKSYDYVLDDFGNVLTKTLREEEIFPDLSMRIDAAKAAAPYFAARLTQQMITNKSDTQDIVEAFKQISSNLPL